MAGWPHLPFGGPLPTAPTPASTPSIPLVDENCALCGRPADGDDAMSCYATGVPTLRLHRRCAKKSPVLARDRIAAWIGA